MDEELTGLLEQLSAEGAVAALTDEDLAGHIEDLVAAVDTIDVANLSAEDLETLDRIATTVEALRAENTQRAEAAATRATEAAERLARIRGESAEEETPEGEEATPAEGEVVAEAEAATEAAAAAPVPVAAAARPPAARTSVARLANRLPAQHRPRPSNPNGDRIGLRSITAAAGSRHAGRSLSLEEAAEALVDQALMLKRGPGGKIANALSFSSQYPEGRRLHDSDALENTRRLDAIMGPSAVAANGRNRANFSNLQGLTAAGGFCAPAEVDYSVPVIVSNATPLVDTGAIVPFQLGGRRGRLKFMTSPRLGANTAGISTWTAADDISALDGDPTKPCDRIDCGTEVDVENEATVKCLAVGNFYNMTYREMVQAVMEIFDADVARFQEVKRLTTMATPVATKVKLFTADELLGTTRNILAVIDRALAIYRDLFRLSDTTPFRLVMNRLVKGKVATDLAREIPGASAERLATEPGAMERFLGARGNLNVTWTMDSVSGTSFPNLASGSTLAGWPDSTAIDLYPEGTWGEIDGGELNLDLVRSPELNAVNDLQFWSEYFRKAFWRGPLESWHITIDDCPDGSTSAPVDINPCTTGS